MICNIKFVTSLMCMYDWQHIAGVSLTAYVNNDTGELIGKKNGRTVTYTYLETHKNLKLKVLRICSVGIDGEEVNRYVLIITGSLHKYYQNNTNWQRFTARDVKQAIKKLCFELHLDPTRCKLQNLEFGLNLPVAFDPKYFINSNLLMYSVAQFMPYPVDKNGISIGCVAQLSQYSVKVYNKGQQYNISRHIIRIELKYKKMQRLEPLGIVMLSDLMENSNLKKLADRITQAWEKVLCIEDSINLLVLPIPESQKKLLQLGNLSSFWINLHSSNPKRYFKKRALFRQLQTKYSPTSLHSFIGSVITEELSRVLDFTGEGDEFTTWLKCKSNPIGLTNQLIKSYQNSEKLISPSPRLRYPSNTLPIHIRDPSSEGKHLLALKALISMCFLKIKKLFNYIKN